ncbi:membrane protein [Spirochaetia bacterium]|nr:membrane protein [Spirochaetia bacterium]
MMKDYDVIVIGGGAAGTFAALAAAKAGVKVCILERNSYIGGVAVSGLPWHGFASYEGEPLLKGIPIEIHKKLVKRGGATDIQVCPAHGGFVSTDPEMVRLVFEEELENAGVSIHLYNTFSKIKMEGRKIESVICSNNEGLTEYRGKYFIDASGDGAVGAAAGCPFEKGDKKGLIQPVTMLLRLGNIDFKAFKAYVAEHPEECSAHEGFNAKIESAHILSRDTFIFIGLPALIKKAKSEKNYANTVDRISFTVNPIGGTATVNCVRQHMIDGTKNDDISRAEIIGRQQAYELYLFMKEYIPGFSNSIIICIGPQIGIRETRRFLAKDQLTGAMAENGIIKSDSVSLGQYAIDVHNEISDSISFTPLKKPYGIPLGALVSDECTNLVFSGRNICSDRTAFAAMRVMGTCMGIGQASGIIAAAALHKGISVADVTFSDFRTQVSESGCQ